MPNSESVSILTDTLPDLLTDEEQDALYEIACQQEREDAFFEQAERRALELIREV